MKYFIYQLPEDLKKSAPQYPPSSNIAEESTGICTRLECGLCTQRCLVCTIGCRLSHVQTRCLETHDHTHVLTTSFFCSIRRHQLLLRTRDLWNFVGSACFAEILVFVSSWSYIRNNMRKFRTVHH